MSINVNQIVLHQLILNKDDEKNLKLETQLRQQLLDITPEVEQMMLQLHQSYQTKTKAYGVFQDHSIFAQNLNRFFEDEIDFLSFSHQSTKLLASELGKYAFADNGTLILCQYNFLATDYLFIALLNSRNSMLVDDNLDVKRTNYLEINQFDIASRINLTDLKMDANSDRYLTFIKGRVGRKISDFFMDFLGAEEGLNPKEQNQCLMQAVSDYCHQGNLSQKESLSVKKQVFEYCKGQIDLGDEIEIKELSGHIPTLKEQPFADFTTEQDYGLAERIPPVHSTLKSLTKFSGSGKGITISFDVELLDDRIVWNEIEDMLMIKGLPPNLRDQLQRRIKEDN